MFPDEDYLGLTMQERRLTVFAVEHSVLFEVTWGHGGMVACVAWWHGDTW